MSQDLERSVAEILDGPLPTFPDEPQGSADDGAELVFHGRVRGQEHGRPIIALDYEYYPEMAADALRKLVDAARERFSVSRLQCWHRVGEVPVGEASLRVRVLSPHRAEALDCLAWFIDQLKRDVPIWKWAVTADGERFPSRCEH